MDKNVEPKTSNADQPYDESFFDFITKSSRQSAKEIVPLVLEFIRPQSVVDVGCGTGAWLSVFREQGIRDILGIDGGYVDLSSLLVPEESFQAHDLVRPLKIGRKFDLVVSLEFAEHQKMAQTLSANIYFAHPYASWERGLNENTNGLIRQYFQGPGDWTTSHNSNSDTSWINSITDLGNHLAIKHPMSYSSKKTLY